MWKVATALGANQSCSPSIKSPLFETQVLDADLWANSCGHIGQKIHLPVTALGQGTWAQASAKTVCVGMETTCNETKETKHYTSPHFSGTF